MCCHYRYFGEAHFLKDIYIIQYELNITLLILLSTPHPKRFESICIKTQIYTYKTPITQSARKSIKKGLIFFRILPIPIPQFFSVSLSCALILKFSDGYLFSMDTKVVQILELAHFSCHLIKSKNSFRAKRQLVAPLLAIRKGM